jgi:thiol-disulfide isomerase/thioredoxin
MRLPFLIAVIASVATGSTDSFVQSLDPSNFTSYLDEPGSKTLVLFYLPWCMHCKRLMPVYADAAKRVHKAQQENPALVGRLAQVDAEAYRALASQLGVGGFPSLWWFSEGSAPVEYRGGQSVDALVDLIFSRGGPIVAHLAHETAVDQFRLSHPVAAVASLAEPVDQRVLQAFEAACRNATEARCGRTVLTTLVDSRGEGVEARGASVELYRASDDATVIYPGGDLSGEGTAAALRAFLDAHSLPPVVAYEPSTAQQKLFASSSGALDLLAFLFEPAEKPSPPASSSSTTTTIDTITTATTTSSSNTSFAAHGNDRWAPTFGAAALALRGEATFVHVDTGAMHSHPILAFFGIDHTSGQLPALALYQRDAHARRLYPLDQGRVPPSAAAIEAFVRAGVPPVAANEQACPVADDAADATTARLLPTDIVGTLSRVLPIAMEEFFHHFYDRSMLRLNHTETGLDPTKLWSRDQLHADLRALAADGKLVRGSPALAFHGEIKGGPLPERPPPQTEEAIALLEEGLAKGTNSFVLKYEFVSAERRPFKWLSDALFNVTGIPASVHLYGSAGGKQVLNPHTDPYDVLVWQLQGSKQWRACVPREEIGATWQEDEPEDEQEGEQASRAAVVRSGTTLSDAQRCLLQELSKANIGGCSPYSVDDVNTLRCDDFSMTAGDVICASLRSSAPPPQALIPPCPPCLTIHSLSLWACARTLCSRRHAQGRRALREDRPRRIVPPHHWPSPREHAVA